MMTRTKRISTVAGVVVLTGAVTLTTHLWAAPQRAEIEPVASRSDSTTFIAPADQPAPDDPPSFSLTASRARSRGGPASRRATHVTTSLRRWTLGDHGGSGEAWIWGGLELTSPRQQLRDLRLRPQGSARARELATLDPIAPDQAIDAARSEAHPENLSMRQVSGPVVPALEPELSQSSQMGEGRWIDVDVTQQLLTAYEGSSAVRSISVSTGLPGTPTPIGQYRVWVKLRYDDMEGPGYYLADVPYTMYFHGPYGLHGTYWHSNFGHPMSHGCVNLPIPEAEWLFNWAEVGTLVNVHG